MDNSYEETRAATIDLPDTNDFILEVTGSNGSSIYKGAYGKSPESMMVSAGTYNIKVVSEEFRQPAFSRPQFGDEQCIVIPSGKSVNVDLVCRQVNCGVKLNISPAFLEAYPSGLLYLKSDDGKLLYAYRETRIAYFNPGVVSLLLYDSGKETVLFQRSVQSQEILSIKVNVASSGSGGASGGGSGGGSRTAGSMDIQVDTARVWTSTSYTIGEGGVSDSSSGSSISNAMTINQARNSAGSKGVWVCGYIVGGDLSSSATGISFAPPFASQTHLAIGPRSTASAKSSCMSVQLPSGAIREALNLNAHPSELGRLLYIKGDIAESYFGIPGIKNPSEYVLK